MDDNIFSCGWCGKKEILPKRHTFFDCMKRLRIIYKQLLEALKRVEWVCDPECRTEDTKYCPWCLGVKPGQWQVNYKAQDLEVDIGHSDDCPRQAAIAAAEGNK